MKVAISSSGPNLESPVDPRFGRCQYLIFCETESKSWEAEPNANLNASGGAGIRTAQAVVDKGVEAVITGNIGPNAMQVLAGQVKVFTGFGGTVEEAIQALKEGRLASSSSATVAEKAGMPGAGPTGSPGGFGGGRGGGRGRGRW
jgi:predicted Fe-Mo cluster-binding NifX family protein